MIIKRIFLSKKQRWENLQKTIQENRKNFWKEKALEMFMSGHEVFYFRGKICSREETIVSFEKTSGFKLNELII